MIKTFCAPGCCKVLASSVTMLEHAGVSIVERHGRHRAQGAAGRYPVDELTERDHLVMVTKPAHLLFEALARHVKSRITGAGIDGGYHIVVAEDHSGVPEPALERREAEAAEAAIVDRRGEARCPRWMQGGLRG